MRKIRRREFGFKLSSRRKNVRKSTQFKSLFHRDLAAMKQVWAMLKQGTIRAFGEIGRQY
tara:strand:+ start:95 stop:274 length:180 start_codon:yes stop_codon:yes gene_type:complete